MLMKFLSVKFSASLPPINTMNITWKYNTEIVLHYKTQRQVFSNKGKITHGGEWHMNVFQQVEAWMKLGISFVFLNHSDS